MIIRLYQREHILLPLLLETGQKPRSLAFVIGSSKHDTTFQLEFKAKATQSIYVGLQ